MDKRLQDHLFEKFPKLYAQKDKPKTESSMCYGFCCGNGWYPLIEELSEQLEPLGVEAVQVKQKFGSLRFYLEKYSREAEEIIRKAEEKSSQTCELCGQPGKTISTKNGFIQTLCEEHIIKEKGNGEN